MLQGVLYFQCPDIHCICIRLYHSSKVENRSNLLFQMEKAIQKVKESARGSNIAFSKTKVDAVEETTGIGW